jgi:tetratricopeptide (TPR) repeat protein
VRISRFTKPAAKLAPEPQDAVPEDAVPGAAEPRRTLPPGMGVLAPQYNSVIRKCRRAKELKSEGRYDEAVLLYKEAAITCRGLASADPAMLGAMYGDTLAELSSCYIKLRNADEALPVLRRANEVLERSLDAGHEGARHTLGWSLFATAATLDALGTRGDEPAELCLKCADTLRGSAKADDDAQAVKALDWAATKLVALKRNDDAFMARCEAVELHRKLVAAGRPQHREKLAAGLSILALGWATRGDLQRATSSAEECRALTDGLALDLPEKQRADIATRFHTLGSRFSRLGRTAECAEWLEQAARMRRVLAAQNPSDYETVFGSSLNNYAWNLGKLDRAQAALPLAEEAVALARRRRSADSESLGPRRLLSSALDTQATLLAALGRAAEALPLSREAVETVAELRERDPDHHAKHGADIEGLLARLEREAGDLPAAPAENDPQPPPSDLNDAH